MALRAPGMAHGPVRDCHQHPGTRTWPSRRMQAYRGIAHRYRSVPARGAERLAFSYPLKSCWRRLARCAAGRYTSAMDERLLPPDRPARAQVPVLEQFAENHALTARIDNLEAQLRQNPATSSRSPSSEPLRAPARPKTPPSGRSRGGQPGHRGIYRALLSVEQVEAVVAVVPERCRHCGQPFPEPTGRPPCCMGSATRSSKGFSTHPRGGQTPCCGPASRACSPRSRGQHGQRGSRASTGPCCARPRADSAPSPAER